MEQSIAAFSRHNSNAIECLQMSMYLSVSRPTGDVIIKPPCYWLMLCVLCVRTKASLLYWLPNPHNVYYLSVAISVTRYHNMAVYEADLIASQILKEFVISK